MQAPPAASPSHAAGTRRRLRLRERPSLLPPVVHGPGGQWARSHIHPCPSPSTCRVLSSQSRQEVELADTGLCWGPWDLFGAFAGDAGLQIFCWGGGQNEEATERQVFCSARAECTKRGQERGGWLLRGVVGGRRRPPAAQLASPCFLAAAGASSALRRRRRRPPTLRASAGRGQQPRARSSLLLPRRHQAPRRPRQGWARPKSESLERSAASWRGGVDRRFHSSTRKL